MKIKWLGHSSFLVTSDAGTKIVIDPYTSDEQLRYGEIKESADVVVVTHDHFDHNNVSAVRGNPRIVRASTDFKGIRFRAVAAYHDDVSGRKRGTDTIFCLQADGLSLCHLGDLGHTLSERQIAEIGKVDILLVPVGGFFTIDAKGASTVGEQLKPRVIIPMHFRTDKTSLPIAGVEEFLKGKKNVTRLDTSEVEFKAGKLPSETQIMLLKPAL